MGLLLLLLLLLLLGLPPILLLRPLRIAHMVGALGKHPLAPGAPAVRVAGPLNTIRSAVTRLPPPRLPPRSPLV